MTNGRNSSGEPRPGATDRARSIGRTSIIVGPISIGAAPLGGLYTEVTDAVAADTLAAVVNAGIGLVDVAPLYGYGLAEERVGRAHLPEQGVALSSKVGRLVAPADQRADDDMFVGAPAGVAKFDFSRDGIRRSIEASLERLQVDRLDLAFIHDPDDHMEVAIAEAYPALDELRTEGIVGAIGAGMNDAAHLARFARETDIDAVLVAGRLSLLDQRALDELLPVCAARGVGVVVGGALNSGVLGNPQRGAHFNYAPAPDEVIERATQLRAVCARHGVDLVTAALQFPLQFEVVDTVLVGARDAAEVRTAVASAAVDIPDDLWAELVEIGLIRMTDEAS